MSLVLRPAAWEDGERLLEWRNDPATRAASVHTGEVARDTHFAWLRAALANPGIQLFIAEADGVPVGTVRAVHASGETEVSWTVAPQARGAGWGKAMVTLLVTQLQGAVVARVRKDNPASARIAAAAGLAPDGEVDGLLRFARRPAGRA